MQTHLAPIVIFQCVKYENFQFTSHESQKFARSSTILSDFVSASSTKNKMGRKDVEISLISPGTANCYCQRPGSGVLLVPNCTNGLSSFIPTIN